MMMCCRLRRDGYRRVVGRACASGALVAAAVLWVGAGPASAVAAAVPCTPIVILQPLCPKTTVPPTTVPPTTAPPTTKAPATTRPTSSATTAPKKAAAKATSSRAASPAASVGDGALPTSAPGAVDLPAIGSGADAVAPQLAGTATSSTTQVVAGVPVVQPQLSVVGNVKGLPDDHSGLRILLSILTALVAAVAVAQVPASRRIPRPDDDPPG